MTPTANISLLGMIFSDGSHRALGSDTISAVYRCPAPLYDLQRHAQFADHHHL